MRNSGRLDRKTRSTILKFQKNEITEHHVYGNLAMMAKGKNRKILRRLSKEELHHYRMWRRHTREDVRPDWLSVAKYYVISVLFGLTFVIKIMEGGEEKATESYGAAVGRMPEARRILADELRHERLLAATVDEEMLRYVGSMVLGLNDALIELTGALAGMTLSLQNTKLIGAAGLVTGIAASLSMAASEYQSQKSELGSKDPLKASFYTGVVYLLAVLLLVAPYFALADYYASLAVTLLITVSVILAFTSFLSVVKGLPFRKTAFEMLVTSMGVAAISFIMGYLVKIFLGI